MGQSLSLVTSKTICPATHTVHKRFCCTNHSQKMVRMCKTWGHTQEAHREAANRHRTHNVG